METGPPDEFPNPVPETAPTVRSWVWHATLESRKAGQVSVLACAETIFAVVLYWWIAIQYDTHWHLVSSVFVAPLLLLRSPESISTGLHWFNHEWLQDTPYRSWPRWKKGLWITAVGHLASVPVLLVLSYIIFAMRERTGYLWLIEIIIYSALTTFFVAFAVTGATLFYSKDKTLCYKTLIATSTSALFTAFILHAYSGYNVVLLANALGTV